MRRARARAIGGGMGLVCAQRMALAQRWSDACVWLLMLGCARGKGRSGIERDHGGTPERGPGSRRVEGLMVPR
jgi:hypothetical protein